MECERRRVSLPYRRGCGRGQLLLEAAADCYRGVTSGFLVAMAASVEGAPRVRTSRAVTHGVSLLVTSIINLLGPGRLLESESQRVGSFANFARNRSRNRNLILRNRPTATPLFQTDSWKQNRRFRFRPRNRSRNQSWILRNQPSPTIYELWGLGVNCELVLFAIQDSQTLWFDSFVKFHWLNGVPSQIMTRTYGIHSDSDYV